MRVPRPVKLRSQGKSTKSRYSSLKKAEEIATKLRFFLVTALPCLVLDQVSKGMAEMILKFSDPITYFGGVVHVGYSENRGAFWGFGESLGDTSRFGLLTVLASLSVFGIAAIMWRKEKARPIDVAAYGLIIAGGLCNILDRVAAGYVVDFVSLEFGPMQTGVFNIADLVIGIGLLMLVWLEIRLMFNRLASA